MPVTTMRHHLDGLDEALVQTALEVLQGGGFDVERLACQLQDGLGVQGHGAILSGGDRLAAGGKNREEIDFFAPPTVTFHW
jgi:hypothetical protein